MASGLSVLRRIEALEQRYVNQHPVTLSDGEVRARLEGRSKPTPNTNLYNVHISGSRVHLGCAATLQPMFEKAAQVRAARDMPSQPAPKAATAEYVPGPAPVVSGPTRTELQRWQWAEQEADADRFAEYGGAGSQERQALVPEHV